MIPTCRTHSHANSGMFLVTLGSNHSNQSHTTFANSRIVWGTCQVTTPAVHRFWLFTLMLQQPSLSLGLLQPSCLQLGIPMLLIWLPTPGLMLGNRRELGYGTSMDFPTRHQLSWELPATASRSQLSPRARKLGHTRDHRAHSCLLEASQHTRGKGVTGNSNSSSNWAWSSRSQDKPVCAAHSPSQGHRDGCHTADQVYRKLATCQGLCLHYTNHTATEKTSHSFQKDRPKPAQPTESQPWGWSHCVQMLMHGPVGGSDPFSLGTKPQ